MDKQEYLQKVAQAAFQDEMDKIAAGKGVGSALADVFARGGSIHRAGQGVVKGLIAGAKGIATGAKATGRGLGAVGKSYTSVAHGVGNLGQAAMHKIQGPLSPGEFAMAKAKQNLGRGGLAAATTGGGLLLAGGAYGASKYKIEKR